MNVASADLPKPEKAKGGVKANVAECHVADFRQLALSLSDGSARALAALAWMQKIGPNCSIEKLTLIKNNRALWLGPADNVVLMTSIDRLMEGKATNNVEMVDVLRSIYGPPAKIVSPPAPAAAQAAEVAPAAAAPAAPAAAAPAAAAPAAPAAPAAAK